MQYLGIRSLIEFNKTSTAFSAEAQGQQQANELLLNAPHTPVITPEYIARTLLSHIQDNDRIAIVSRKKIEDIQPYIDAIYKVHSIKVNIQVRHVKFRSSMHEYCFLTASQKEMIGPSYEDNFLLAGILSESVKRVILFDHDDPSPYSTKRNSHGSYYQWNYEAKEIMESKLVWWDFVQERSPLGSNATSSAGNKTTIATHT